MTRVSTSEAAIVIAKLVRMLEDAKYEADEDCHDVEVDNVIREAKAMIEKIRHE